MSVAAAKFREWREDPVTFVREVFGATPDAWQADVLRAFPGRQRIAMKACKGPGKSTVEAWCAWNFLLTRPHPKVVCTSISGDNLRDGLWAELSKWQQQSPLLKHRFKWGAERIVSTEYPETWWASARQWSKSADPSQQANTLAGIHADYVLFVIDESGGVPDGVVTAAEAGLATGIETKIIQGGNPTHLSGPLYRACTRERHLWLVVEISSAPDDPKRTPRVSRQWAQEQIDKYGVDHPWVLVNVFGKFPPGQSNTLIGLDEAVEASKRVLHPSAFLEDPRVLGLDVARFGDDRTVFAFRQGRAAFRMKELRSQSTMVIAGQCAHFIARWKPDGVMVDEVGVGGGVVDRLRELGHPIIGVQSGGKPIGANPKAPRCKDLRAEMWWSMADWVRQGGAIPDDAQLIDELSAPTYHFASDGRIVLESKDDMKARGLSSPDKADALAFTFAMPVARKDPAEELPGRKSSANRVMTDPRDYDGPAVQLD